MALLLIVVTVAAGVLLPLQVGMNSRLADFVGGPVRASFVSFVVGTAILFAVTVVVYRGGGHRAGSAPWWAWIGGAIGAFYVVSAVVVGPRIGATTFFGILVAAQLVMSVVVDRFGWLGFTRHPPSPARLVGVALLVAGGVLVRAF